MSRSPREYLRHILDEMAYLTDRSQSLGKAEFLQDATLTRAFVRSLEIIGEASKNVPADFRQKHSQVDWRGMAAMRDRLIHGYFGVDHEIVWDVVVNKVPALMQGIEQILAEQGPPQSESRCSVWSHSRQLRLLSFVQHLRRITDPASRNPTGGKPLNIVVCTKQVPDTAATLKVDEQSNVSWGDAPLVINPWDEYAVEEALLLKEKHGGKVSVTSMGPDASKDALKHAVAMGCDEAIQVWDDAFDGSDAPATAAILAKAIEKLGDVDLVLFGRQAIDGDTGLVAPGVARRLGWPQLTYVAKIREIDPGGKTLTVERLLEEGRQVLSSKLPAIVSVVKEINEPRYPSFMGIRKASKMQPQLWSATDLGIDVGSVGRNGAAVRWTRIFAPPPREGTVEIIDGDAPEAIAATLADKLMAEKVI